MENDNWKKIILQSVEGSYDYQKNEVPWRVREPWIVVPRRVCQKTDILKAKLYFHSPAVIAIWTSSTTPKN